MANVALNLCSQKSSGFSSARSVTALRSSRKFIFTLHPEVGKTKLQVLADFAFRAFRLATNFVGIGISRSLYAFGVQPRSGLWLTRTVDALSDVRPVGVHDLLFAHARHQKELKPQPFLFVTGAE